MGRRRLPVPMPRPLHRGRRAQQSVQFARPVLHVPHSGVRLRPTLVRPRLLQRVPRHECRCRDHVFRSRHVLRRPHRQRVLPLRHVLGHAELRRAVPRHLRQRVVLRPWALQRHCHRQRPVRVRTRLLGPGLRARVPRRRREPLPRQRDLQRRQHGTRELQLLHRRHQRLLERHELRRVPGQPLERQMHKEVPRLRAWLLRRRPERHRELHVPCAHLERDVCQGLPRGPELHVLLQRHM
mmetsp:Transcript_7913/g.15266  ORF Transcript_7913/g.15266 Transcript_7913/m.15266 type:complete len:239 (-) Transcript_7913:2709-3425(-)